MPSLICIVLLFADVLILTDGTRIEGSIVASDDQHVWIMVTETNELTKVPRTSIKKQIKAAEPVQREEKPAEAPEPPPRGEPAFDDCTICRGTGWILCQRCGGLWRKTRIEVLCKRCEGVGQHKCPNCHGKGHVLCIRCRGTGKVKHVTGYTRRGPSGSPSWNIGCAQGAPATGEPIVRLVGRLERAGATPESEHEEVVGSVEREEMVGEVSWGPRTGA